MTTTKTAVERNNRRTRWYHAGVYLTVLVLLFTGWWLTLGQEGAPSPLAELFDTPDTDLHTTIGWVFVGVAALGLMLGRRAAWSLASDSVRFRRSELRWFARWPAAVFTGRFGRHEGHFDPGQRIANVVMIVLLAGVDYQRYRSLGRLRRRSVRLVQQDPPLVHLPVHAGDRRACPHRGRCAARLPRRMAGDASGRSVEGPGRRARLARLVRAESAGSRRRKQEVTGCVRLWRTRAVQRNAVG